MTEPQARRERIKEAMVVPKGYENRKLVAEHVTDVSDPPPPCGRKYRRVILRKNISVQRGERVHFDEVRYFSYLTNRWDLDVETIVSLANDRCDHPAALSGAPRRAQDCVAAAGLTADVSPL